MRAHYEVMSGSRIALWRELLRKVERPPVPRRSWWRRFLEAKWIPSL
jgi:hypothetical protein